MTEPAVSERGASIVELGVAMMVSAVMSAALVTWMTSAGATMALHQADDVAVQDLRLAKERMSRELRLAEDVLAAQPDLITVWVDDDDDDFTDSGEEISWYLGGDGTLWRWTDAGTGQVQASHLTETSRFGYDSPSLDGVTSITIVLEVEVADDRGVTGERSLAVSVHLRNRS